MSIAVSLYTLPAAEPRDQERYLRDQPSQETLHNVSRLWGLCSCPFYTVTSFIHT